MCLPTEELSHISVDHAVIGASLEDDLLSLKEGKERPDWPKWKVAMDVKVDQLVKKGRYKLIKLPLDHQAISCKWVYHIKCDHVGEITKHKVRLICQRVLPDPRSGFCGYVQTSYGIGNIMAIISTCDRIRTCDSCGQCGRCISQWHPGRNYFHDATTGIQ
jgi:hypothetical protein